MSGKNNKLVTRHKLNWLIYLAKQIAIPTPFFSPTYDGSFLKLFVLDEAVLDEAMGCRPQLPCNRFENPSPTTHISRSSTSAHSENKSDNLIFGTKGSSQSNSIEDSAKENTSDDSMIGTKGSSRTNSIEDSAEENTSDDSMIGTKGSSQTNSIEDSAEATQSPTDSDDSNESPKTPSCFTNIFSGCK